MTEAQLIERSRQGDPDAFEALVRSYSDLVFRVAFLVTRDAGDAEDAAQDAFVKAWYSLESFDPERPFRPWLLRIAGNEARNRRTSATRRNRLVERAELTHPAMTDERSPEQIALGNEAHREVFDAFNKLREDDRLVLACRYFFDLSEAETAETLGVARGTVKSRLSRALGRLRGCLTEGQPECPTNNTRTCDEESV